MKLIDFRYRPNTKSMIENFASSDVFIAGLLEAGISLDEFRGRARSMDEIIADLKANNVVQAVMVGRDSETTYGAPSSNPEIQSFVQACPELFTGFAGADPHKGRKGLDKLTDELKNGGFKGVALDPMYAQLPADDAKYYPIYTRCCDLNVPVIITAGPARYTAKTVMGYTHPDTIDRVAMDFPDMKIIVSHGGWPYVTEMIGVCYRNKNVYMELSEYENHPGSEPYIAAMKGSLKKQILFGSAAPVIPYMEAAEIYTKMDLPKDVLEHVMWKNAARILGLPTE